MKIFLKILLLIGFNLSICNANSLNIVLDSQENINKFDIFMSEAKDKEVKLNLKFCADKNKCNRPNGIDNVSFKTEIMPNDIITLNTFDPQEMPNLFNTYTFSYFFDSLDNSGFVNIDDNVKIVGPEDCENNNGYINCEYKIFPAASKNSKTKNSNTCDIEKALNNFCNSNTTKNLIFNKLKKGTNSDVSIEIVSLKASQWLLDMNKGSADEKECQKAQTNGICDVIVAFEGIRNGNKAREEMAFEATITDNNVDIRKK